MSVILLLRLFPECYRKEELSASELSLALEGGEFRVGCVVVAALVENVGQRGGKLDTFVELVGELCVEHHHVLVVVFGQLVAVMLAADRTLPFAVGDECQAQLVLHRR